jgi:hypothetical protein
VSFADKGHWRGQFAERFGGKALMVFTDEFRKGFGCRCDISMTCSVQRVLLARPLS